MHIQQLRPRSRVHSLFLWGAISSLMLGLTGCGVGQTDSLNLMADTNQTVAGASPITLIAPESVRSGSVTWRLAEGSPGNLDASSGKTVHYIPPPAGSINTDTIVTVIALVNNLTKTISIQLHPSPGLYLIAGNIGGRGSSDGMGTAARFNSPSGITVDAAGNLYVPDQRNNTIRKISAAGVVTTLAGTPQVAGSADGTGAIARFNSPSSIAVDATGNVYVADTGNQTIRKITPAGVVTTLAGAANVEGTADGVGAAARFRLLVAIAIDGAGNLYVSDYGVIRKITSTGSVTTPPTSATVPANTRWSFITAIATDTAGNLYVRDDDAIRKITPGGTITNLVTAQNTSVAATVIVDTFFDIKKIAVDATGNLYFSDITTIRKLTPAGVLTTLAGTPEISGSADGTGANVLFNSLGLAVDANGNLFVSDLSNATIRKITPAGEVTTLAGMASSFGSNDGTGAAARFYEPAGLTATSDGSLYVADPINSTLRKITPAGIVTTLAGKTGSYGSNDGTLASARFNVPLDVARDTADNLYLLDGVNHTIRKITPAGEVTTLAGAAGIAGSSDGTGTAARFYQPFGLTIDATGNLYVSDTANHAIRKVTQAGVVTTIAGMAGKPGFADGMGTAAQFYDPMDITVDTAGNLYIADWYNHLIRKITPMGSVTTVAGLAHTPGNVDGIGSAARFNGPIGIAVDSAGTLYVADKFNSTIRKITSAGVVTTVAGKSDNTGMVLGSLPGGLDSPNYLTLLNANTLAITARNSVIKLVLP